MTDLFDYRKEPEPRGHIIGPDEEFAQFWSLYPRHVARKAAETAFKKARRSTPFQTILIGVQRYAAHVRGLSPEYVLHASTYLNGERWADELVPRSGGPMRGTDALREQLRQEIDGQGFSGPEDFDPRFDGRFPRLTH